MKNKEILFTTIALLLPVLLLEILLRFLPVGTGLSTMAVTHEQPVAKFTPNTEFTYSDEWYFAIVNKGRINNDGFVNDINYDAQDTRPLMAVVGDSYVESLMLPTRDTIQGQLANKARVYSFAASGAPLSQYLIWAKYVKDTYKPSAMTFVVVGNDFDESLPAYDLKQVFHQFVPNDKGALEPVLLSEYHPTWKREIIKKSAIARYIFFNLNAWQAWAKIKLWTMRQDQTETTFAANTNADTTDKKRMNDSKKAVDAFLNLAPRYSDLKPHDIVLVMDASRRDIYAGKPEHERLYYFDDMRRYMMKQARTKGFAVVDMDPVFTKHYAAHGGKFEFDTDAHWNALAHSLAAKEVEKTNAFKDLKN